MGLKGKESMSAAVCGGSWVGGWGIIPGRIPDGTAPAGGCGWACACAMMVLRCCLKFWARNTRIATPEYACSASTDTDRHACTGVPLWWFASEKAVARDQGAQAGCHEPYHMNLTLWMFVFGLLQVPLGAMSSDVLLTLLARAIATKETACGGENFHSNRWS